MLGAYMFFFSSCRVSVHEGRIRGCKQNWLRIAAKMDQKLQLCGDISKYAGEYKTFFRRYGIFKNAGEYDTFYHSTDR